MRKSLRPLQRAPALKTVPISSSPAPSSSSSVPQPQPHRPVVVSPLQGRTSTVIRPQPNNQPDSQQPDIIIEDGPNRGAMLKRQEREWDEAMETKKRKIEKELAEMQEEKERLERELTEMKRVKEQSVLVASQHHQDAGLDSGTKQTWPLILRRLMLAEQALHAVAVKKSLRDKQKHPPLVQQRNSEQGVAQGFSKQQSIAVGQSAADDRRSSSPALNSSVGTGLQTVEETHEMRVANFFTDVTRMLSTEFSSCCVVLNFLDSLLIPSDGRIGSEEAFVHAEVVLRIASILFESCHYCRIAISSFLRDLRDPISFSSADYETRMDAKHTASCNILTLAMQHCGKWMTCSDTPTSLALVTVRFFCTVLPCCSGDELRNAVRLMHMPEFLSLLQCSQRTRNIPLCRDILCLVRIFLRVADLRVRPLVSDGTASQNQQPQTSVIDSLCQILRKQSYIMPNRFARGLTWSSDIADMPRKENADDMLSLQHDIVRLLLTALSSCSRVQFGVDGNTCSYVASLSAARPSQGGSPRVLLSYNYQALIDGAISVLHTTITRYGSELPAHSELVCDVCDLLCLCSCNEDAFAAGYVSVTENPQFVSSVSMLNKCVTPFEGRHKELAIRARRLTDLAAQRTSSSQPGIQQPNEM